MSNALPLSPNQIVTDSSRPQLSIDGDISGYVLVISVVIAAQLGLFLQPQLGVYVTTASLGLLMAIAAKYDRVRGVVLALALIPLIQMVNLSLVQQSAFEQTIVVYVSMLVLSLVYRVILKKRIPTVDNHSTVVEYTKYLPVVIGIGGLLGLVAYRLLINSYVFGGVSIGIVIVAAILGAISEESLFRGLIQRQSMAVMPPLFAVLITSLVYISLSFSHFSIWSALVGALSSLVLSVVYARKQNLILTTLLNITSKLVYVWLVAVFLIH